MDFTVPVNHKVKIIESEKRDKYWTLLENKEAMEHEGDGYTNCNWCTWNGSQKGTVRVGIGGIIETSKPEHC